MKMVIDRFYFSNGDSAGNLDEFLEKLEGIDDECFFHHVNEEKNDFANWILYSLKYKALGNRISELKDKKEIISAIRKKVNSPAKIKSNIISQIKEAILNG